MQRMWCIVWEDKPSGWVLGRITKERIGIIWLYRNWKGADKGLKGVWWRDHREKWEASAIRSGDNTVEQTIEGCKALFAATKKREKKKKNTNEWD